MTTPVGPIGSRSSSTVTGLSFCCHSSMAPSRVGVARSCSTGGGATPEAAKASGEGSAERPLLLRICTRYANKTGGSTVRLEGSVSVARVSPGGTGNRTTGTQAGDGAEETAMRQTSAVMGPLTGRRSFVVCGVVQCSRTRSPMRSAVRSFTVSGRLRDGGRGGAGLAHPNVKTIAVAAAAPVSHLKSCGWRRMNGTFIDL